MANKVTERFTSGIVIAARWCIPGANDGMLHAFNDGFFHAGDDPSTPDLKEAAWISRGPGGLPVGRPPGERLCAFILHQLLPQLQWLARP